MVVMVAKRDRQLTKNTKLWTSQQYDGVSYLLTGSVSFCGGTHNGDAANNMPSQESELYFVDAVENGSMLTKSPFSTPTQMLD